MTTPDLRTLIRSLVERWLASPDRTDLTEAVRVSGALPVCSDMGGTLLLRPDGEILLLDNESGDDEPQIETTSGGGLRRLSSQWRSTPNFVPSYRSGLQGPRIARPVLATGGSASVRPIIASCAEDVTA
jgi:hypothetical protein